jgi:hypothetical protein
MGKRNVVHVVLRDPGDPGQPPNATVGQITADFRVWYPPHVGREEVRLFMETAYVELVDRFDRQQREQGRAEL